MKKIMIVEDDEVIKDELSELLKNSSYLVESVKNFLIILGFWRS